MSFQKDAITKNTSMMAAVTAVASIMTLLAIKYNDRPVFCERAEGVPQNKGLPLVGSLFEFIVNNRRQYDFVLDLCERNDTLTVAAPGLGLPIDAITLDPQVIEHVLKINFKNYIKGPNVYKLLYPLLGNGIFNVDGEKWRWQRKTASHIFNVKNFRDKFTDVFVEEIKVMCTNVIDKHVGKQTPFDFKETISKFTLDSFVLLGFGINLNTLGSENKAPFAESFNYIQRHIAERFLNPLLSINMLFQRVFQPKSMTPKDHIRVIDDFAETVIKKRREELVRGIQHNDLLSRFMNTTNDLGEKLNDTELRDSVLNFIIAGSDTTAQTLSWLFYELSLNPDVEERLMEELGERITDDIENDSPELYKVISRMNYFHAVFYETLRLYPAVPLNQKYAIEKDILPGGIVVPAGTYITWCSYAQGRSTKLWGKDAKKFNPERWLDEAGGLNKFSQGKWSAFHAGPRFCLGQGLATLEILVCLAMILRRYKFTLVPGQDITYDLSLTLPMKDPLNFYAEKR